ncbi:MAG: right-handed parallel beta-helix repeat-containing protein [Clostridia bacterium]|nr:right-handed parallel beta-helix repeat-containing protein [Clostridia bacterium]
MILYLNDYLDHACGDNITPAIVAAVDALQEGDTLCLGGGRRELFFEGAFIKQYYISNNDYGKKPIAFPLIGKKNVTIDGEGADLIFHGELLPFVIDDSSNVTIKNLSIDYACPIYAQSEVVESDRYKTVLRFDGKDFFCRVENDRFCFYNEEDDWEHPVEKCLTLEFEKSTGAPTSKTPPYFPYCGEPRDHGFLRNMYRDVMLEQLGDNLIAMHGSGIVHTPGNYLIMTHCTREYPGIFINESKNVTLSDITLHHTLAMGIIAQLTDTITLERVRAVLRKGTSRVLSVNADATHFVNCRGKITMRGCKFVSMMDDACNIHGIYNLYNRRESEDTLILGFGHHQQRGIQIYRPGDRVAIIDSNTNETIATRRVVSAVLRTPDEVELRVDGTVAAPGEHWVVENLSTAPDVHIVDCESGNNRPRGFLISSAGKVLVEKCRFYNMNQGIQLGGEMKDWYESGAVTDVTIRDNDFDNSAYAGGAAIVVKPHLRAEVPNGYFHGRVVIENNRFVQSGKRMMIADLTQELVFRGNTFRFEPRYPDKGSYGDSGVKITNCGKIDFEDAKIIE